MSTFAIWILTVVFVVALGWGLAGNWGNVVGFYYIAGSGVFYFIKRFIQKNKSKFTSQKVELGKAKGFFVKTDH